MKVLLLNPPSPEPVSRDYYCGHIAKGRSCWPALDLVVLSGALHAEFDVQVLDAVAEGLGAPQALDRIRAFAPEAVVAVVAAVSWSNDMAFLSAVKAQGGARIAVSGDYPLAKPLEALAGSPCLDAVILDFTECELPAYLAGRGAGPWKNLVTRADPRVLPVVRTAGYRLAVPRHDLFPLRRYHLPTIRHHPFALLATDYGCAYRCRFCFLERVRHKNRDIDNVAEELEFIRGLGIRELVLEDASFGSDRAHAEQVCRVIRDVGGGRFTWVASMRVDAMEETLLRAMKAAGAHRILIGVETPNDAVLERFHKGTSRAQILAAFALARRVGLRTLAHFIVGLAGEDRESLDALIAFSVRLRPDIASFNVAAPAWNTSFRDEVVREHRLRHGGVEIAAVGAYPAWESAQLPAAEVWRMRNLALRRFYLRPSYLLGRMAAVRSGYECRTLLREGASMIATLARGAWRGSP